MSFAPRRARYNIAVVVGGAAIALTNWAAMADSGPVQFGETAPIGILIAPAIGGLATGLILAFSKRPAYMDSAAGTYAAFAGALALIAATLIARASGGLPEDGTGFARFGPVSVVFFILLVGSFNTLVCFPVSFAVIFGVRSLMPGNVNKYGWQEDEGMEYVTPGPPPSSGPGLSTAKSRFSPEPVRYSSIPSRHRPPPEE